MGYSTTDGTAGKGLGSFTNTATTEADFDKVLDLIARMGNRRVGTTAQRTALTGSSVYEGLEFYDTDLDETYLHTGSGWVLLGDTGWTAIATFGANWSATAGYTPRVRRVGHRVDLAGAVTIAAGGSFDDILTIPTGFRPLNVSYPTTWVGSYQMQTSGATGMLHITNGAGATQYKLTSPSQYRTGSPAAGQTLPLLGSWFTD